MVCILLEILCGHSKRGAASYNCVHIVTISGYGGVYAESSAHGFYDSFAGGGRGPAAECPGTAGAGCRSLPGKRASLRPTDAAVLSVAVQAHAAPVGRCRRAGGRER